MDNLTVIVIFKGIMDRIFRIESMKGGVLVLDIDPNCEDQVRSSYYAEDEIEVYLRKEGLERLLETIFPYMSEKEYQSILIEVSDILEHGER